MDTLSDKIHTFSVALVNNAASMQNSASTLPALISEAETLKQTLASAGKSKDLSEPSVPEKATATIPPSQKDASGDDSLSARKQGKSLTPDKKNPLPKQKSLRKESTNHLISSFIGSPVVAQTDFDGTTADSVPDSDTRKTRNLPHLRVSVSGKSGKKIHDILATYDNCCTDGLISSALFRELQQTQNIEYIPSTPGQAPKVNTAFQSSTTAPLGRARVKLTFTNDDKSKQMSVMYSVWVLDTLCCPLFIGNDFIHKPNFRVCETNELVTFRIPDSEDQISLPFVYKSQSPTLNAISLHKVVVKPFDSEVIMSSLPKGDKEYWNFNDFCLDGNASKGVPQDMLLTAVNGKFPVVVMNPTPKPITISKGHVLGQLTPTTDVPMYSMAISDLDNTATLAESDLQPEETPKPIEQTLNIEHLTGAKKKQMWEILKQNRSAFSTHDFDIGLYPTEKFQHTIELSKPLPKSEKQRLQPRARRDEAERLIDLMIKHDILEPCMSPFASNVTMVKKKSGKWRMVLDARRINSVTLDKKATLGIQEDILQKIGNKRFRSSFDLRQGYFQVGLDPEVRHYTAFYSPDGRKEMLQWKRCVMGLKTSSTSFNHVMNTVLQGLDFAVFFLDDILICSDTWEEHLRHIDILLQRLREVNLKLDPAKCEIASARIRFLGLDITYDTIRIPEAKSKALRAIKSPTSRKGLLSFLAAFSYYRKFIRDFAGTAEPLYKLVRKDTKFKWTLTHEEAVTKLKNSLADSVDLYIPTQDGQFILSTDSSLTQFGATLEQIDPQGRKRLVACASKSLRGPQLNYAIYELECQALVWAIQHFDFFLRHNKFVVQTDSRALLFLARATDINEKFYRMALKLTQYDFDLIHVPGKYNALPDYLSRQETNLRRRKTTASKHDLDLLMNQVNCDAQALMPAHKIRSLITSSDLKSQIEEIPDKFSLSGKQSVKRKTPRSKSPKHNLERPKSDGGNHSTVNLNQGNPSPNINTGGQDTSDTPVSILATHLRDGPVTRSASRRRTRSASAGLTAHNTARGRPASVTRANTGHRADNPSSSDTTNDTPTATSDETPTPPPRRKRGRPRKDSTASAGSPAGPSEAPEVTTSKSPRPRGRPRKDSASPKPPQVTDTSTQVHDTCPVSEPRKRGRPRTTVSPHQGRSDESVKKLRAATLPTAPCDPPDPPPPDPEPPDSDPYRCLLQDLSAQQSLSNVNMKDMQLQDDFCKDIIDNIGDHEGKFSISNGILITAKKQIVLPQKLVDSVIFAAHYSYYGAHTSKLRTKSHLLQKFFCKNLAKRIDDIIDSCYFCQLNRPYTKPPANLALQRNPVLPRTAIAIDMAVSMPPSQEYGYTTILLIVDLVSGYITGIPMKSRAGEEVLNAILQGWVSCMGMPTVIVSDNEKAFKFGQLPDFCRLFNIEQKFSLVANPKAQGQVENAVKQVKTALKSLPADKKQRWHTYLYLITNAVNSKIAERNKESPEETMFGYSAPRPFWQIPAIQEPNEVKTEPLQRFLQLADSREMRTKDKFQQIKRSTRPTFKSGSLVLKKRLFKPAHHGSHALDNKYEGPFLIKSAGDRLVTLKHIISGKEHEAHVDQIKPFLKPQEGFYNLPTDWDRHIKI